MSLRIVFTREDLQRVRIERAPSPMWELVQSLHHVQERSPATHYLPWYRDVRRRIAGHYGIRSVLGPLCTMVPKVGGFPDFLTPDVTDIEAGCESIAGTSKDMLLADLSSVFADRPAPLWIRELAEGDRSSLAGITATVRTAYDILVQPYWPEIRAIAAADHTTRSKTLCTEGLLAMLTSIPGVQSWTGEVLTLRYPITRTLYLNGRGITFIPSYFCWSNPISFINPDLPPVVVYRATAAKPANANDAERLTALLGYSRAVCLQSLARPHTTSSLAARVGISLGSASKQTTTLRHAGLVTSHRQGKAVIHQLSPLGEAVLAGGMP